MKLKKFDEFKRVNESIYNTSEINDREYLKLNKMSKVDVTPEQFKRIQDLIERIWKKWSYIRSNKDGVEIHLGDKMSRPKNGSIEFYITSKSDEWFFLSCYIFSDGGTLPKKYKCDTFEGLLEKIEDVIAKFS